MGRVRKGGRGYAYRTTRELTLWVTMGGVARPLQANCTAPHESTSVGSSSRSCVDHYLLNGRKIFRRAGDEVSGVRLYKRLPQLTTYSREYWLHTHHDVCFVLVALLPNLLPCKTENDDKYQQDGTMPKMRERVPKPSPAVVHFFVFHQHEQRNQRPERFAKGWLQQGGEPVKGKHPLHRCRSR